MDVTITLSQDEAIAAISSLERSRNPRSRAAAVAIRSQVTIPLRCPVTFRTPDQELCAEINTDPDEAIALLTSHLDVVHGMAPEQAAFQASKAVRRWMGPQLAINAPDTVAGLELDED